MIVTINGARADVRDSTATRSHTRRSASSRERGGKKEREKGKEQEKKKKEKRIATPMDDSDAQILFGASIKDLEIICC